MTPTIQDAILGQLAAFDPEPIEAWDAFVFIWQEGTFATDSEAAATMFAIAVRELRCKGFIDLFKAAGDIHPSLTELGWAHMEAVLGTTEVRTRLEQAITEGLQRIRAGGKVASA